MVSVFSLTPLSCSLTLKRGKENKIRWKVNKRALKWDLVFEVFHRISSLYVFPPRIFFLLSFSLFFSIQDVFVSILCVNHGAGDRGERADRSEVWSYPLSLEQKASSSHCLCSQNCRERRSLPIEDSSWIWPESHTFTVREKRERGQKKKKKIKKRKEKLFEQSHTGSFFLQAIRSSSWRCVLHYQISYDSLFGLPLAVWACKESVCFLFLSFPSPQFPPSSMCECIPFIIPLSALKL